MKTLPSIAPFDAIKLKDGTYCFSHHNFWGSSPYIARPKYVPTIRYPHDFMGHFWIYEGTKYSRLKDSDAVDHYISIHQNVFDKNDSINSDTIETVVHAQLSRNDFLDYTRNLDNMTQERKAAFDLIEELLRGGIPMSDIGITGSILLKGEVAGFSDFDLVLYGASAIGKAQQILKEFSSYDQSPLYYRTKEESIKFYHKYSVVTELTAEEFSETFPHKVSQGIMSGIPFSIFQVPAAGEVNLLKGHNNFLDDAHTTEAFEAIIEDALYSRYTYQSVYKIKKLNDNRKIYDLHCCDRACMEQAEKGDRVLVSASKIDDFYVIHAKKGFIKPAYNSGDK